MQLFYTPSSPFALCVRRVICELGINEQVTLTLSHPFDDDKDLLGWRAATAETAFEKTPAGAIEISEQEFLSLIN